MLVLKDYQEWALDALRDYFQECTRTGDANTSFYAVTRKIFGKSIPYTEVDELPGLPYVCLRIPTGGGKTIVACHSIGIAARDLVQTDSPLVLWLVPSNAILEQTLMALRNRNHPYRQAVESTIGKINVLDVQSALYLKRAHVDGETTIIVTTMQSFRVEDTFGRRVYRDSGDLMDHFTGLHHQIIMDTLEKGDGGNILCSLTNVLRLRRPIVIVDEAHNARTSLSFETLARFNPACIIEFTATPAQKDHISNVLYSASAADLKSAQMIKLPIRLDTRSDWKELLSDAIFCRNRLEKITRLEQQETGEYIRPVMLIQAQPQRQGQETLTVDVVKQCLMSDHYIPEEQIAIVTSATKELEGVDIAKPDVPVRYVITISALREGWDCPFAYVLCSVAESRSATGIEQILGRVMRLPGAIWKNHEELNMAYAFATSASFGEIAKTLTDALVQNGFEKQEAQDLIIPVNQEQLKLPFDDEPFMGMVAIPMTEMTEIEKLPDDIREKITFDETKKKLTFKGEMSEKEREEIKAVYKTDEGKAGVDLAFRISTGKNPIERKRTPSERNVPFNVPVLTIRQGDLFEEFEETHFLDRPWELAKCDALLTDEEYSSKRPDAQTGTIDINKNGKVTATFVSTLQTQMELFARDLNLNLSSLVFWLDQTIEHTDISPQDSGIFLTRLVQALIEQRGMSLERLVLDKYRLKKAVEKKINKHRLNHHHTAYQMLLFGDEADVAVTPDIFFAYPPDPRRYTFSKSYRGRYQFNKHYYPVIGDLEDSGEEAECAQYIDQLDDVEFWVRNPVRRPEKSFWIQTSTDKFYPDFVCKLKDGRFLVVEYKGGHLMNDDSKEKKILGELWAMKSNGLCLFVMPTDKDYSAIQRVVALN